MVTTVQHLDPNAVAIVTAILMGADHIAGGGGVFDDDTSAVASWVQTARAILFEAEQQMLKMDTPPEGR
ncbi:MAG: hypothetical protein GY906_38550 [bacterium]|nr:hypothetical protein [bacterium]